MSSATEQNPGPGCRGCPVCDSFETRTVVHISGMPVLSHRLWKSQEQALKAPRGDIQLNFCRTCGHLYNAAYDPHRVRYDDAYDNAQQFSPLFRGYLKQLAGDLVWRHDLCNKQILEVGCGDGTFLRMICDRGGNQGIGFDPGARPGPAPENSPIRLIRALFRPSAYSGHADLVCCRHVLEHIPSPRPFLEGLLRVRRPTPRAAVYIEVPNGDRLLKDLGFWDLIYEHCAFFTSASLRRLFYSLGCGGIVIREGFSGQFLCAELSQGKNTANAPPMRICDPAELSRQAANLAAHYRRSVAAWQQRLAQLASRGQRAALWGAGSKGVSFLNAVRDRAAIRSVVDVNPRKHDTFIAGTGQRIVAPESLMSDPPDWVIAMNPAYTAEIRQMLVRMGLEKWTTVVTAGGGSDILTTGI